MRGDHAVGCQSFAPGEAGQTLRAVRLRSGLSSSIGDDPAGLQVDALVGGHRVIRVGGQNLSGLPIDDVHEAVSSRVKQDLSRLAAEVEIDEHVLLDLVVVPKIVRVELVGPMRFAAVRDRARIGLSSKGCRRDAGSSSKDRDWRFRSRGG